MKIGNLLINKHLFLAPMAGVTDKHFRILCKEMSILCNKMRMLCKKYVFYVKHVYVM